MFDRVSKLSRKTFVSERSGSQGDLDDGSLEPLLADAEAVQYVLASAAGIEQTMRDRTTTIEPGADHLAYAVVSNRRIYFLVGADATDPELTVDLASVSGVDLRNAFLSSTLVVSTDTGSVSFVPADTTAAAAAVSYVSRVGGAWSDLFDAIEGARESLAEVESAIGAGEDPRSAIQRTRTRLSNAHHCATHVDDAPTDLMTAEIEPVEAELDRLRFGSRLERAEGLIDDARAAQESGAFEDGVAAVVEATAVIRDVASVLHDAGAPGASDRLTAYANDLDVVAQSLLNEAERSCHRALAVEDPGATVDAWEDALARYREAVDAGWDGPAGTSLDALRFQVAWVTGNLVDALTARADAREAAADELNANDDDAVERYEAARDDLTRARGLADEHSSVAVDGLDDRLDELDRKIERAEWQWGAAN